MVTPVKTKLLVSSILAGVLMAQPDPRIGLILNQLAETRTFQQVEISPDGKRVAWVENGSDESNIYVKELRGGAPARIGTGANLAWSPDSSRLAFLDDRDHKGQMQLYTAAASGGHGRG